MLLTIPDVLTAEQVATRARAARQGRLGRRQGHGRPPVGAREEQPAAARGIRRRRELGDMILTALQRNPLFMSAALPLRVFPPLFNRYQGGQAFGNHVDNAIRQVAGTGHRIRTDLSATLFLAEPDEYDGGELIVEDTYGVHRVKLPAGDMVLYPVDQPAQRDAGDARRARRVVLLDSEHGARRRPADAAVRSRHGHPAALARRAGASGRRAADGRLPQPASPLGGDVRRS